MSDQISTRPGMPNQILSERVVTALREAKLIPTKREPEILGKFVDGSAQADDWKAWATALLKEERDAEKAQPEEASS